MRLISALLFVSLLAPAARSAELVVFEQKGCVWCQRFDRDIAPAYDKTTEGKRAPLRRQDIKQPIAAELAFIKRERFTPVFVLIDQGREIGRITLPELPVGGGHRHVRRRSRRTPSLRGARHSESEDPPHGCITERCLVATVTGVPSWRSSGAKAANGGTP